MINKNEFRKTEAFLYNYSNLEMEITSIELELESFKNDYKGCGSIGYDDVSCSNNFNSTVENEVVDREKKIKKLEASLQNRKIVKKKIDTVIRNLNEYEKKMVELRYINIDKKTWEEIARALRFSVGHCKNKLRKRVLEKFQKILFL